MRGPRRERWVRSIGRAIWEAQVVDILQPDGGPGGGISQMQKVAALCEAHPVPMAPWGLTARVHGAASVAFFLIHEGYDYQLPEGVAHKTVCVAAGGAGIGGGDRRGTWGRRAGWVGGGLLAWSLYLQRDQCR